MAEHTYEGSCHCGAVKFAVDAEIKDVLSCNCSICNRVGALRVFVPATKFRLQAGESQLADYQFGKRHLHHQFCRTCGVHPIARGVDPRNNQEMVAVNVRCIADVEVSKLSVRHFDGAKL